MSFQLNACDDPRKQCVWMHFAKHKSRSQSNQSWRIRILWLKGSSRHRAFTWLFELKWTWGHLDLTAATGQKGSVVRAESGGQLQTLTEDGQGGCALTFRVITFSKWSRGFCMALVKTSSGHRTIKLQLHKVGAWYRMDKWDFTSNVKPRSQPAKYACFSWDHLSSMQPAEMMPRGLT